MSTSKRPSSGETRDQRQATRIKMDHITDQGVYIVGYARTPVGDFQGALSSISAPKLGGIAIRAALADAGVDGALVQEVVMGNVLTAGVGQAPARQAALNAGLPDTVPATTVNKVCASGMKAAAFAAQAIMCRQRDIVVAGGMENMSSTPHLLTKSRAGYRLGHGELVDSMIKDGLWDVSTDQHMGSCAEQCATRHGFTREQQDDYTKMTYQRAVDHSGDIHADRIAAVEVNPGRGKPVVQVVRDERPAKGVNPRLTSLKPYFEPTRGTVTAGNASPLSDGAAALVLASGQAVKQHGLKPIAQIVGFADAARKPEEFTDAPADAVPQALQHAGVTLEQVDLFEVNEAFAVVALANSKMLNLSTDKVNIAGGAVAIGHPLGCSGARILCTLMSSLAHTGGSIGVAGICNGGGGASAMVVEMVKQS